MPNEKITEKAIEKVVSEGWKPLFAKYWGNGVVSVEREAWPDYRFNGTIGLTGIVSIHEILLDPSFWQALGKALGWPKQGDHEPEPYSWQNRQHRLIAHIQDGKNIESYFEELL